MPRLRSWLQFRKARHRSSHPFPAMSRRRRRKMIEQLGVKEIGPHGYEHWSGKAPTPHLHEPYFVPQSIADGWECYCTCGEYRAFANFYEHEETAKLIEALRQAHARHAAIRSQS